MEPDHPAWKAVIERYYKQLEQGGMKRTATADCELLETGNRSDLIEEIQKLVSTESQASEEWNSVLSKLEPVMVGLQDLAEVIARTLGMDDRVASLLWGSMRLILKYARPVFPQLITLFQELRTVLPKSRLSEQTFPLSNRLEAALLDVYTEIIVFYAYTITFFRNNPNATPSQNIWSVFRSEFDNVTSNLRTHSRKVDEIVAMRRLSKYGRMAETINVIKGLEKLTISDNGTPCHLMPDGLNTKFFGRSAELDKLKTALDPGNQDRTMRVVSLFGSSGVGKTQLALQYAHAEKDAYHAIAWLQAEVEIKLLQSLGAFASKLGLPKEEGRGEDIYETVRKVRDWLNHSGKTFLLVFDDVADANIPDEFWPVSGKGSIIIISKRPEMAGSRANESIHLKGFEEGPAVDMMYELTRMPAADDHDGKAAKEICRLIEGLPLAIVHVSSFIRGRGYSYKEFLALDQKHTETIAMKNQSHDASSRTGDPVCSQTLNNVWDMSLESLSSNARNLLHLLSFFDPSSIPESLLTGARAHIVEPRLKFLGDDVDLANAVSELTTKMPIVNRITASASLSLHRLVRHKMFMRVPEDDHTLYLDSAIQIIYHSFPITLEQQGHDWQAWETCSAVVGHLSYLLSMRLHHDLKVGNVEVLAELLFRFGKYLWERGQPTTAESIFHYGLSFDIDSDSRLSAQARHLLGHIALDVAQPFTALSEYMIASSALQKLGEHNSAAVAEVYESRAHSFLEINDVSSALHFLSYADNINFARHGRTSARTQTLYALVYLRDDKPEKAHEALLLSWKLQNKTQYDVTASLDPNHASEIVLFARIQYALGLKEEGLRLASRSIAIRRGTSGAKGPRVADSVFLVARMLAATGEHVVAAKMLREVVDMSRDMPETKGHLARALWFLAGMEELLGNPAPAEKLRKDAKDERAKIYERKVPKGDDDEAFMRLVGWMLW